MITTSEKLPKDYIFDKFGLTIIIKKDQIERPPILPENSIR